MTKRHLDEGTIQAYLDGELAGGAASGAAAHAAACVRCAGRLAEAAREAALFAGAFAPDDSVHVPTETLRARVNAAVARLEADGARADVRSGGRGISAFFAPLAGLFALTPQRAAGFAAVLAVAAFALVFSFVQRQGAPTPVSNGTGQIAGSVPGAGVERGAAVPRAGDTAAPENSAAAEDTPARVRAAGNVINARYGRTKKSGLGPAKAGPAVKAAPDALLPGEENYREAIASLEKAVELGGDEVLSPKARFAYERNLALLDGAIAETRRAALRDPKDREAVGFLMAAYQSKVDLLTTVADQAQVAAIGR